MPALTDVQTWLYHLGDVNDARAAEIAATNADMVVTEWADYSGDERPYTAQNLDDMRGTDADRLIVSYISIGEAENYRYYWEPEWEATPPAWIDAVNPEWIDNIKVRYWDADWQEVIFDYVEKIVDAGFNGVYLDIVEGYEYWEEQGGGVGNARDYRADMADFVAEIRAHAEARLAAVDPDRDFVIIGQNGFELLEEQTYADAVDGVAKEDARFYYEYGSPQDFEAQRPKEYAYTLDLMQQAETDGIASFAVEYIPDAALDGAKATLAIEAKDLGAAGIPLFIADNRDLDTIPVQPAEADTGVFPRLTSNNPVNPVEPGEPGTPKFGATTGDDNLRGTKGDDKISGRAGNDEIRGFSGKDTLKGGTGEDELYGGKGRDKLKGGADSDLIEGGGGRDKVFGGSGSDELFGGGGKDKIIGGRGGDLMDGGGGADTFVLRNNSGFDEIDGFDIERDRLDIKNRSFDVSVDAEGLIVDFGGGDEVVLIGLNRDDLNSIAFI